MLDNLESNYDCAHAGDDLHQLKQELESLREQQAEDKDSQETINRLENQISFILNKCNINHQPGLICDKAQRITLTAKYKGYPMLLGTLQAIEVYSN